MKTIFFFNMLVGILLCSQITISQNSKVEWSSFNMGFAESKSSNTIVKSIAGQSFVGSSGYGNSFIESGFLADTLFRGAFVNVKEQIELPSVYKLYQNYPNPFNPTTTIKYDLPMSSHITIKLYNVLGQEVITLVNEFQEVGFKTLNVDASNLASGVYLYQIKAGDFAAVRKFVYLK